MITLMRIGGWISCIILLLLIASAVVVFVNFGFPANSSQIDWEFVPSDNLLPLWYFESSVWLHLGIVALLPAPFAFFSYASGRPKPLLWQLNVLLSILVGGGLVACAFYLPSLGLIRINRMTSIKYDYSDAYSTLIFAGTLLLPFAYFVFVRGVSGMVRNERKP